MHQPEKDNYVVAVCASAGGLEAINEFFDYMKNPVRMSFVIIQHLSSEHKSLLVELVAKHTNMHVLEVLQDTVLEPGNVYVIPNDRDIQIMNNQFRLINKRIDKGPNVAIDTFLFSLAKEKGSKAIALILSGTGTDGTKGIESIKSAGGLVIVQDPDSARFDGMPRSAINSDSYDIVQAPSEMPQTISSYVNGMLPVNISKHLTDEMLTKIYTIIKECTGHDFTLYKPLTIHRRISKRMVQAGVKNIDEFIRLLEKDNEECQKLAKDFLIGVTQFFRDDSAFKELEEVVIPRLIKQKKEDPFIKVWVAACSTGEEAYSIAILLDLYLRKHRIDKEVKIFASDVNESAIQYAFKGQYPATSVSVLHKDILDEYFVKSGNEYVIVERIRKQLIFARHNILQDPPYIKNDLVSCRNMLIYMEPELQPLVIATLHFSLNKGGFLFLGMSDSLNSFRKGFDTVNQKNKIFAKNGEVVAPIHSRITATRETRYKKESIKKESVSTTKSISYLQEVQDILVDNYAIAVLCIDSAFTLLSADGELKEYIMLPERKLNFNLLKMLPADLSVEINTAVRKAWKSKEVVTVKHIRVRSGTQTRRVNISVKPYAQNSNSLIVLTQFEDKIDLPGEVSFDKSNEHYDQLQAMQTELEELRNQLQVAIEGMESSNEELQSSNEELISSNEELQSSNEELQSLNEELHTLNAEHQLKIKELIELNEDLDNFFRTNDVGQIFVDKQQRIRKFNPAALHIVNLRDTDIQRKIGDFATNTLLPSQLENDVATVITTNDTLEKEVVGSDGSIYIMRILPYLRRDGSTDGAVITFINVTEYKELDLLISGIFNSNLSCIIAFRAVRDVENNIMDFRLLTGNKAAEKILQGEIKAVTGRSVKEAWPQLFKKTLYENLVEVVNNEKTLHTEIQLLPDKEETWFEVVAVPMKDGFVVTLTDITEKKRSEERLVKNYNELVRTKETLKNANINLEQKVLERTQLLTSSEERFRLVSKATNDSLWDWDIVNNQVWYSDNFYKVYGYSENDVAIERRNFWFEHIHPDDRERVMKSISFTINNKKEQWTESYRFLDSNGHYAYVLDRGYLLLNEYNMAFRMLGSMLDVTGLRKAEEIALLNQEEKKFLAESMPLMLWTSQPNGRVNFANHQFETYTGLSADELDIESDLWRRIVHAEDFRNFERSIIKARKEKSDFFVEVRLQNDKDDYEWFLFTSRAQKDDKGNVLLWISICTGIQEQKNASDMLEKRVEERTRELQMAIKRLEDSNIELQQYAFVASHDLKEPLRKIHIFTNMLKDGHIPGDNEKAHSFLNRIVSSSARMSKMIEDLLNYSRISKDSLFEPVDLNTIVHEIVTDLEIVIEEKEANIHIDELPVIDGVSGQLRQVFQNLLTNALKFSKDGVAPEICIRSELTQEKSFESKPAANGQYLRVTVTDNGIGFNEMYLEKIFVLFQRLNGKEKYEGTGIGLAVTKKIIEKHHGLVTASSEEGQGAVFTVVLPVTQGN